MKLCIIWYCFLFCDISLFVAISEKIEVGRCYRYYKGQQPQHSRSFTESDPGEAVDVLNHGDLQDVSFGVNPENAIGVNEDVPNIDDDNINVDSTKKGSNLIRRKRQSQYLNLVKSKSSSVNTWQHGVIPFLIEDEESQDRIKFYRHAMKLISQHTCIQFVPLTSTTKNDYGLTHDGNILFKHSGSSIGSSFVGNVHLKNQHISCMTSGQCLHELSHCLGFRHEQQLSSRKGIVQVIWENIPDHLMHAYAAYTGNSATETDSLYDIGSCLHYPLSHSGKTQMKLLHPELSIQSGNFYQYREISNSYQCAALCPDFTSTCMNDGYITSVNGRCNCICPDGLDPESGCSTILPTVHVSEQPGGSYALPQVIEGCDSQMQSGMVTHKLMDSYAFKPYLLAGAVTRSSAQLGFCVSDSHSNYKTNNTWPAGSYCIYRHGEQCPSGFDEGQIQFDNDNSMQAYATTEGILPEGGSSFGADVKLAFCCRQDGSPHDPIRLANDEPFAMYPMQSACQKVQGTMPFKEEILLKSDTTDGGVQLSDVIPNIYDMNDGKTIYLRYCTYYPLNNGCGGVIQLDDTKTSFTFASPNYPDDYPRNTECRWVFTCPEKSLLTLSFEAFDLEDESNSMCIDTLEIGNFRLGTSGRKYCGTDMLRAHRSIFNTISVVFRSSPVVSRSGFKAVVQLHKHEDMCYNISNHGTSYRGRINFTQYFETCLHWSDRSLIGCKHFTSNLLDIYDGLDSNYCRNPGDGTSPWCYTSGKENECKRSYCDVCLTGGIYDTKIDCHERIAEEPNYCDNVEIARKYCAKSCIAHLPSAEAPHKYVDISCQSSDIAITDGSATSTLMSTYMVGETVTFTCDQIAMTREKTLTCNSDGTWTPIDSVCSGCPIGWYPFGQMCHRPATVPKVFSEAANRCQELGGEMSLFQNQETEDFFLRLKDDGRAMWNGLKCYKHGGTTCIWQWPDYSRPGWTNWADGADLVENRKSACALTKFTKKWDSTSCKNKALFNCQMIPDVGDVPCMDESHDRCLLFMENDASMCDRLALICRKTCGLCQ